MADVTVSAPGVAETTTTIATSGRAGATIIAGQPLYADAAASNTLKPCQATTAAAANCVGVALHGTFAGQSIRYAVSGDVTFTGTTFALGTVYVVSANAGGIAPSADLDASSGTNYGTIIGIASSATNLKLSIMASGALNP